MMICLHLALSTVGQDLISGQPRLIFVDQPGFSSGISFVVLAIGVHGIGEILHTIETQKSAPAVTPARLTFSEFWYGVKALDKHRKTMSFGSILGFFVGMLPAAGATPAALMSYGIDKLMSKTLERFDADDRVAIVLPNGPEMATALVIVAQAATTAPLNLAYREDEYTFYPKDLKAKALLVQYGCDGPALAAASKLGMRIIRLSVPDGAPAGRFTPSPDGDAPRKTRAPGRDDLALILHTSGTTSRPKIVPLTQTNVGAPAQHIRASLDLQTADRCMNVVPLFHIHGVIAAVAASLSAGGSMWCAPGFDALKFFGWMKDAAPTWYTAVLTMHQTILSRLDRNADVIAAAKLRFLRSSSASHPAQVMVQLQETFGAPVIEAYGMTEAAHQRPATRCRYAPRSPARSGSRRAR